MSDTSCFITAIANPRSGAGDGLRRWSSIAAGIEAAGRRARVVITRDRNHAMDEAAEAAAAGDLVVAVGGDGLVLEVATGVVRAGGTMAVIPSGRGNDLAAVLGLPSGDAALTRLILDGPVRRVDVLETCGFFVPGNVYFGIDGESSRIVNDHRWVPRRLLYRVSAPLALIRWRPVTITVDSDGVVREERVHTIVLANSGRYGNGMPIVPSAVVDDGVLEMLTITAGSVLRLVNMLPQVLAGTHVHRDDVSVRSARVVTLRASRPMALWADGEVIGELPAEVRVRPGALGVIAPDRTTVA